MAAGESESLPTIPAIRKTASDTTVVVARSTTGTNMGTMPPTSAALESARERNGNRFRAHAEHEEQPRQIIALACMVGIAALGLGLNNQDAAANTRAGILGGALVFLTHAFLQLRDSIFVRPHPGFWRVVHGAGTLYLIGLASALFQTKTDAQSMLHTLFPSTIPSEQTQVVVGDGIACELTIDTLSRQLLEVWFIAHVAGWWAKMCVFRDWYLCWVLSIGFELLELSMGWLVPQFRECWWDSLFVDLLGANVLGMILGSMTLRFLENREFDFGGHQPKRRGRRVQRVLSRFSPFSWRKWEWEVFSSFKRLGQIVVLVLCVLMTELNAFMLLNAMEIPKKSHFHKYRLGLFALLGAHGVAEYYEYISTPDRRRLGPNAWLLLALMQMEILVWIKFIPRAVLEAPTPADVKIPWMVALSLISVWALLFYTMSKGGEALVVPPRASSTTATTTSSSSGSNNNNDSSSSSSMRNMSSSSGGGGDDSIGSSDNIKGGDHDLVNSHAANNHSNSCSSVLSEWEQEEEDRRRLLSGAELDGNVALRSNDRGVAEGGGGGGGGLRDDGCKREQQAGGSSSNGCSATNGISGAGDSGAAGGSGGGAGTGVAGQTHTQPPPRKKKARDWRSFVEAVKSVSTADLLRWLLLDALFVTSFLPLFWLAKQYDY